jgi:tetratricopeptide (TPR) repeat protein
MRSVYAHTETVRRACVAMIAAALTFAGSVSSLIAQTQPAPTRPADNPAPQQPSGNEPGQYWFDLAQVHQRYGMTDEAEKCYTKAVEVVKSPQMKAQILSNWAELLLKNKKFADASDKLSQALVLTDDMRAKWRIAQRLARAFEETGDLDAAAAQYEFLMQNAEKPEQKDWAQNRLFDLYQRLGKCDDLIKRLQVAAVRNPSDPAPLQALVTIYTRIKPDDAAARKAATELAIIKSDDPSVLMQLADLDVRMKDINNAVYFYLKVASLQPAQRATCYERICSAYLSLSQKDKALEYAERETRVAPESAQAWLHLGDVCMSVGQGEKAVSAFSTARLLAQSDAERDTIKLHLANAYRAMNQDADAISLYKELSENSKSPVSAQAKYELFQLYSQRGALDKVEIKATETPTPPAPK